MANLWPKCPTSKVQRRLRIRRWTLDRRRWTLLLFNISFVILLSGCGDLETVLSSITISPSSATVGVRQSQLFQAVGKDSLGKIVSVSPSYSVGGGVGSVSSAGLFTAGSVSGEGSVVVTYGANSSTATVTVTDRGWVSGRVTDNVGNRVPSLKVSLAGTTLSDLTDPSGDYSISNIPAGTYEVKTLETSVYRSSSYEVTVASGETETVNFTISYFTDPVDLTPPEL